MQAPDGPLKVHLACVRHRDCGRSHKHFRGRTETEHGVRRDRLLRLNASDTKGFEMNHAIALNDGDGRARRVSRLHFLLNLLIERRNRRELASQRQC